MRRIYTLLNVGCFTVFLLSYCNEAAGKITKTLDCRFVCNFKKSTKFTFLILVAFLGQLSCTIDKVEHRKVLKSYDNGQLMQELVKYKENDTLVEFTYFLTGQLNQKRQLLNNQRTGWSHIYTKNGELLFQEHYLNNMLTGEFKAFYPSGQISRIEHFRDNKMIDTSTYFLKNGEVEKKIIFLAPCEIGSCECNQNVVVYENGSKVYSYEVNNGIKSKNQTVYDQTMYQNLMGTIAQEALFEKGELLFRNQCGTCHRLKNQPVGPALSDFSKTITTDELAEILIGSKGHPASKITEEETAAIIEYIHKHCS